MNDVEYLEAIISPLLTDKSAMNITRTVDEMGVLLTLDVAGEDMGKIIGKAGETAKSVRNLLRQFGGMLKSRITMKINEPAGSERRREYKGDRELVG